jgi:hypothetical protein
MSIDLRRESGIPISEIPKLTWITKRREGKRLHVSTCHRWCSPGLHGIRLEFVRVGGQRVTSEEALVRFFARLADRSLPPSSETTTPRVDPRVDRELDGRHV